MSARVLVWVLAVQLLLAAAFAYFAITGFPFLPHHAACTATTSVVSRRFARGFSNGEAPRKPPRTKDSRH